MKNAIKLWGMSCGVVLLAALLWAPPASAFMTYSTDGSTGNCANCHGDFNSGFYVSNTADDPAAWGTNLMTGHQDAYGVPCSECHSPGGFSPVYLNPEVSVGDFDGLGCVGCHGRFEDATPPDGPVQNPESENWGDGLRAHHEVAVGTGTCTGCHSADSVQVGEDVPPETFADLGIDACDENGAANAGTGNFGNVGLDNDGDGLREPADPDCAVNTPPVADAGADQTVNVGDTVTLDGSGSSDADGDPLTYAWTLTTPAGSAATLSDDTAVAPTFVPDVEGTYTATLIVNDGLVDSAPDSAVITAEVVVVNTPPVADAGPDQNVTVGDTVTLDGSGSSDADGDPLSYSWSFNSVPAGSAATLSDPTAVNPTFVADVAGDYVAQLIVNDGMDDSAPDSAVIVAAPPAVNLPPVADAGPDQQVTEGQTVFLDGSGSSDPDGDPISYSWSLTTVPPGSAAALSDPTAVNPSFFADVAGTYVAQLIVNDGEFDSAPDTVVITAEAVQPPDGKVTICHIPPGNPRKAKTLSIDAESVPDHLGHGDLLGACPGDGEKKKK